MLDHIFHGSSRPSRLEAKTSVTLRVTCPSTFRTLRSWRNSDVRRVRLERIGRTPLSKPLQIAKAQTAQEPRASRADAKMAGGTPRPPGPRPPSSFRKAFIFLCFSTF
ncbi:unnamed protein product [Rangifer tarandus platyrhynchus]|uniref:Uncharacterized protein n=1 Tax=Rangifer tarandus platyrhynchus TaxID=3082113 RepID=A0AC59Z1T0_RANTA